MRKLDKASLSAILTALEADMTSAFATEGMGSDDISSVVEELECRLQMAFRPIDEVAESVIHAQIRLGKYDWLTVAKGMRNVAGYALNESRRAYRVNFKRCAESYMVHNITTPALREELYAHIEVVGGRSN